MVSEGVELNFVFYHLSILHFEPWSFRMCASPCWTRWRVGTKRNETLLNIEWQQNTNQKTG